jgi:undecaprenyl-diphosphatase
MPISTGEAVEARWRAFPRTIATWIAGLARAPRRGRAPAWSPAQWAVAAAVALAAIGAAMVFADDPVRLWVRSLSPVSPVFHVISDFGRSAWILIPVAVVALLLAWCDSGRLPRQLHGMVLALAVRLGFVFVAVGLPGLLVTIGKRWVGRVRPSDFGPFAYHPLSWKAAWASLPSGHTTTAFAALVAIGFVAPRFRPLLWVYAVAVAVSRVAISAHYVSDVIAGAAVGALFAILVRDYFAARRLGFYVGGDGRVGAMPGPSWPRLRRLAAALARP